MRVLALPSSVRFPSPGLRFTIHEGDGQLLRDVTHALWGTAPSARSCVQNLEAPRRVGRQLGSQSRTRAPLPPARSWRKLRELPKASSIWSIRSPLPVILGLDRGWGDGVVVRAPQKTTEQNRCAAGPSAPLSRTIRKEMSYPCGMTGG